MDRVRGAAGEKRPGQGWRRLLLLPLLAAALLLAGVGVVPSPAWADSAPQDPQSPETPVTVAADALPTVQINGVVWSQAMVGDIVYAGGSFTTARPAGAGGTGVTRNNMLAYNIRTGALVTSFAPSFNAQVKAVAVSPDRSRIYVGGDFTTVNGLSHRRIAAFNATTGALLETFNPPVNYHVNALVATNTTVYAGGEFQDVGTQIRQGLAAFNASNGALLNWTPAATGGDVWALALNPAGTKLAVGGAFTALNGSSNPGYGLGMVDASTGASLPFLANNIVRNGTENGAITTLTADDDYIYGGGYTFGRAGGTWEGTFAASWNDGAVHWANDCHGDTYSLHAQGDVIYAASHAHYCENIDGVRQGAGGVGDYPYFRGIAFGRDVTGTATWEPDQGRYYNFEGQPRSSMLTWYPNLNAGTYTGQIQGPWSVTGNADFISMAGEFTRVNGQNQQGLVRFARPGLAPNDQGPSLFNTTYPLNLRSTEAGKVRISWATNQDIDNDYLTYRVYRDVQSGAGLIHTRSVRAHWWNPYGMGFTDTGLAPGSTHRYRVAVTDPFGNIANSPWTDVTVASAGSDGPYVQAVDNSEPTHWWRLDDTTGTTLADSAGFQPLTITAGPTLGVPSALAADTGTATRFPGTSTTRAYTTVQDSPPDVFTLEGWFKTTVGGGKIIGRGNRSDRNSSKMDRQIYLNNAGQVLFGVKPNATRQVVTSPASYNDGLWHHVAASLSPAGMKLYLDGAVVAERADVKVGEHLALGYWRIGGDGLNNWPTAPTNAFFNGDLDEIAVYYRALSAGEIAAHHAAGSNVPPPNQSPVADFNAAVTNLSAEFTAAATDADGTVESYAWSFGDGDTSTEQNPSHAYATGGTYDVTLTVTDDDGATGTVTKQVTVAPAPNQAPVADFSSSAAGLTASFTSSATDADGTVEEYAWSFGDGDTSTEPNPSHAYATGGTYDVTLTVTDDGGATGTVTKQVLVTSGPTPFAVDAFGRTVVDGWGSAETGGAWTRSGTATNFSVTGGSGRIRMGSAGSGPAMALTGVSSTSTDLRVKVGADKAATGGGIYLTAQPRRLANGDRYFTDVRFLSSGAVSVTLGRNVGGTDTFLQSQTVAGLTVGAGDLVNLRVQATGTSPTTVRAKVWAIGSTEPAGWNVSVNDSAAALQSAGHIGLRTYLSGSATNAPVFGLFDDLVAGPA
ncbi:PKD domain-containing protein [Nocardioides caricicola]|uniref:PKD domain-containing protein n=1 Tax=Nocardioides caricicola TaxID=634770 RepID=A0ABW0MX70_9ACTN